MDMLQLQQQYNAEQRPGHKQDILERIRMNGYDVRPSEDGDRYVVIDRLSGKAIDGTSIPIKRARPTLPASEEAVTAQDIMVKLQLNENDLY